MSEPILQEYAQNTDIVENWEVRLLRWQEIKRPVHTTIKMQPPDQVVIRTFTAHCRRQLLPIQHEIDSACQSVTKSKN